MAYVCARCAHPLVVDKVTFQTVRTDTMKVVQAEERLEFRCPSCGFVASEAAPETRPDSDEG